MKKTKSGTTVSSYFDVKTSAPSGKDVYKQGSNSMLGQVEKVHFVDESSNQSKKFVEYDVSVRDAYGGQSIYRNIRAGVSTASGFNDFEEIILEPNEVALSGKLDPSNFFQNKNGAMVVVSFLNGSLDKPYISNTVDHPKKEGAKKADGIRWLKEFRGIHWEVNKNGELILSYNSEKTPDGKPTRPETAGTTFKMDKDGDLLIFNKDGQRVTVSRKDKKITLTDGSTTMIMDNASDKISFTTAGGVSGEIDGASNKITLTAGSSKIIIDGSSGKIQLDGNLVDVGTAASALAVLGPQLIAWLTTHIHNAPQAPAGVLPTTPPLVPPPTSILSTSVKIKS